MFSMLKKNRILTAIFLVLPLILLLSAFAPMQEGGIVESIDWEAVMNSLLMPNAFGVPIILLVIGLTYALGKWFEIHGKWQFITAMALGLVFGAGYQAVTAPLGYSWQAWFFYIVYGLIQGLIATLLYDTAKDLLAKIIEKMLGFKGNPTE